MVEAHSVKHKILSYAFNERNYMAAVTEGLNNADVLGIDKRRRAIEFEIKVSRSDLQKELAAIKYANLTTHDKEMKMADGDPEQLALNIELASLKKKSGGWSKISKHQEYIDPTAYFEKMRKRHYYHNGYVPNVFYFVVPSKLVKLAIEGTVGTGYGVIAHDGCRGGHYGYLVDGVWYTRDDHPEGARWQSGRPCEIDPSQCYPQVAVMQKAKKIHDDPVSDWVIDAMLQRAVRENINMLSSLIGKEASLKKAWAEIEDLKLELKEAQS